MTKVLFLCPGVPTATDPLGASDEADPTPTLVEAELVRDNGDGTQAVRVGPVVIGDATEGTGIRQWRRRSRLTAAAIQQLRTDVVALMQDADPNVATAARAVAAALARHQVPAVLADLRAAALNANLAGTTRAQALTLIGLVLAEERDR